MMSLSNLCQLILTYQSQHWHVLILFLIQFVDPCGGDVGLVTTWWCWKSWTSARSPVVTSLLGGNGMPWYCCETRVWKSRLLTLFPLTPCCDVGMKVTICQGWNSRLYLSFFDTTLVRMLEHFITAWQEWESRLITQPLLVWMAVNPPFLLYVWLEWMDHCLEVFFLARLTFCWSLEKAMATHSSTLAWKIPWMEEPGRLQSMGLLRVGHDWVTSLSLFTLMHWRRKWQPTPVFLPGESQGWQGLVGCRLWGCTESDTTEAT